jgi:hypothetical protein
MFLSFNCLQVDDVFRLKLNISSVCYEGQHKYFMLLIIIPSIIVWVVGIPLFAIFLLVRNKKFILLMTKKIITQEENEAIINVKTKYGFLF